MADKESTEAARIKSGIEKFFYPLLISTLVLLLTMAGAFIWSAYLKLDNIQSLMGQYTTDVAVLKNKVENLEKDVDLLKKKQP